MQKPNIKNQNDNEKSKNFKVINKLSETRFMALS